MKKIGFLFIEKSYVIYHSIGIAIELAKLPAYEVHILCTNRHYSLISEILDRYNCTNIIVEIQRPHWYFNVPHYIELTSQILRKSIYFKYRNKLKSYDAFVCTIYLDLFLKRILHKTGQHIKYIYTDHGIPNRPYAFDNEILDFDLFFMLGDKEKKIRKEMGQLLPYNHAITGYPKYELVKDLPKTNFFNNNNPIVLYNPHWQREYMSFGKFGIEVFDFFANNKNFNLIFAPHTILIERNFHYWFKLKKYEKHDNIIIDYGSELSYDMTYTKSADLYVGDISSQALEFVLIKERPCLFLDAHDIQNDNKSRPLSWDLGEIISKQKKFKSALKAAFELHEKKYKAIQTAIVQEMFYIGKKTPSYLAAQAIDKLLKKE